MNQHITRSRKGRKYQQVIDGARQIFMREGFEGASVDAIAKAAGVSKATLYSYFPDKEVLFLEIAQSECTRQAEMAQQLVDPADGPDRILHKLAHTMTCFFLSDFGLRVFRVCVAESERFPELGRAFYRSGPELARSKLVEYLKVAVERGDLDIEDCDLAAAQFIELCKASLVPQMIFNIIDRPAPEDVERVIDGAVQTFLARYGVKRRA